MTPSDTPHEGFTRLDRRIIVGGLCVCVCVAPLLPAAVRFDAAFAIRSFVLLCVALVAARMGWAGLIHGTRAVPVTLPACVTLVCMALTLTYTPNLYGGLETWTQAVVLFLLFVVLLHAPLRDVDQRYLVLMLVAGGVLSALYALMVQWTGHGDTIQQIQETAIYDEAMKAELIRSLEANRALGRFGNPNHLAGYLVLCLWGCWWLWHRGLRWFGGLAAVILTLGTYQTFSRSGLLVLAASLVLIAILEAVQRGWRVPVGWILGGALAGLAGLVALVLILPSEWFGGRLLTLSTVVARMHFYRGALEILQTYPWLGVGLNGFEAYYSEVLRPGDLEARFVHNWWLECAVEGGIVLVAIATWLLVAVIRFLSSSTTMDFQTRWSAIGCVMVFTVLASIDFHNRLFELWLPMLVFLGLSARSCIPTTSSESTLRWGIVIPVVLALFWGGFVLGRYVNEQTRQDAYGYLLNEHLPEARAQYQWAVTAAPYDAESWNHLGMLWRSVPTREAQQRSLTCLRRAVEWSPRRASLRADYAETLFALGYAGEGLAQMRTAVEHFPSRADNVLRAATLFRAAGEVAQALAFEAEAQRILEQIEERNP